MSITLTPTARNSWQSCDLCSSSLDAPHTLTYNSCTGVHCAVCIDCSDKIVESIAIANNTLGE